MKAYFLRHGLAVKRGEWEGDDAARPLTEDGVRKTVDIAAALARLDLDVESIITSPLVRAKATADIVARTLGLESRTVEDQRLAPGFDAARLRAILRDHRGAGTVMLVGHEPDFSETLSELIGGGSLEIKKAGLALVDLPDTRPGRGRLRWLIPPKMLARLGRAGPPAG